MNEEVIHKKQNFRKYLRWFWILFGFSVVSVVVFFWLIARGVFGFMPTFEELENPQTVFASEIFSEDNQSLGKYYQVKGNRLHVEYNDLNPVLIDALIATEDIRFYKHSGIDFRGLIRVVKGIVTGNTSSGGGSTITQQLAKNLFPTRDNSSQSKIGRAGSLVLSKFKEWIIAVRLEKSYTKDEIITMYLNRFGYLNQAVGIRSASSIYFSTTPSQLQMHEAAMLVGMAKNPSLFNPLRRPELTLHRRNVVLSQMLKYRFINKYEFDSVKVLPLGINYNKADYQKWPAPYFRKKLEHVLMATKPHSENYVVDQNNFLKDSVSWETNPLYGWCNKNRKADGSPYNIYKDGLRIYTTLNSKMQIYAENAVMRHLKELQPVFDAHLENLELPNYPFSKDFSKESADRVLYRLIRNSERYKKMINAGNKEKDIIAAFKEPVEMTVFSYQVGEKDTLLSPLDSIKNQISHLLSSFMAMDPHTGEIKAWVGGPNISYYGYDMVMQGKRQVGSTCKPFLYTLAMQNGLSPCKKVPNSEVPFLLDDGSIWIAKNSDPTDYDDKMVTLKWGLANSVNQVSAWVMKRFNPNSMVDVMRKLGVLSPIDPVVSLFLGTSDITLYEMVAAYATYANRGVYTSPIMVTKIEDKNGNVLATFKASNHDALDEKTAYLMINMLENVVNHGSGIRLRQSWRGDYGGFSLPIAGKTGTTQNQSDGWFVGFTPELVAAAWTGCEFRGVHFESLSLGQGANMALPVWGYFMKEVLADTTLHYSQDVQFERPEGFSVDLECDNSQEEGPVEDSDQVDDFF